MILNILGAIMCCSFVGANTLGSIETSQEVSFYQENKKLASYHDDVNEVTFYGNELKDYTFYHLGQLFVSLYLDDSIQAIDDVINDLEYGVFVDDEFDGESLSIFDGGVEVDSGIYKVYFTYVLGQDYGITFYNDDNGYKFFYGLYDSSNQSYDDYQDFLNDSGVVLGFDSEFYSQFKSAIQADISANQTSNMADVLSDFITILVSGISTLATGIAAGVVDMSKALFLTVDSGTGAITGLSTFGGIIALFAGIALAVGITTKVYLWITRLGKN